MPNFYFFFELYNIPILFGSIMVYFSYRQKLNNFDLNKSCVCVNVRTLNHLILLLP